MKVSERSEIPVDLIDFEDTQFMFRLDLPEEEIRRLEDSIKRSGQLNPIKVRRKGDRYQIIAGRERAVAVRNLADRTVLADVYENITDEEAFEISILDNLRASLSDLEVANQVRLLRSRLGYSVKDISGIYGWGTDRVYDLLTLSKMRPEIKTAVHKGKIDLSHAIELNLIPVAKQLELLDRVVDERRSLRWLRDERIALTKHPFTNFVHPAVLKRLEGEVHAVRFIKNPDIERWWTGWWKLIGKHVGIPAPLKCEATFTIPASKSDPPFICRNEIEWAILCWDKYHIRKWRISLHVPLKERDVWLFLCERCARTLFPNCKFHEKLIYNIPRDLEEPLVAELN